MCGMQCVMWNVVALCDMAHDVWCVVCVVQLVLCLAYDVQCKVHYLLTDFLLQYFSSWEATQVDPEVHLHQKGKVEKT